MKEILEMIESVDPSDTAKLDEIDARVWCYLNDIEFVQQDNDYIYGNKGEHYPTHRFNRDVYSIAPVSQSRDALKSIRPKDFKIHLITDSMGIRFTLVRRDPIARYDSKELPTEELAELHAVLQAISHDRGR